MGVIPLKSEGSFSSALLFGTSRKVRFRPRRDMKKPSSKMTLSLGASVRLSRERTMSSGWAIATPKSAMSTSFSRASNG